VKLKPAIEMSDPEPYEIRTDSRVKGSGPATDEQEARFDARALREEQERRKSCPIRAEWGVQSGLYALLLLPTPFAGGPLAERLYRQLAGRGHGMPWVFVGAGKDQVVADTKHSVTLLLKPNLSHLIGALEPTLNVVQMAMDRFGAIAGLGDADWWIARPTPPTW
jgi:hypothetical protein